MRRVHIIGGGLAGLSAAVELAGAGVAVALYEAAPRAGGRCRSYFDATLGQTIDNGNHFTFSGNQAVAAYLAAIGASERLTGPAHADFAFHDLTDSARWRMRVNDGALPLWAFSAANRAPGTSLRDHLALARLMFARPGSGTVGEVIAGRGAFWSRVVEPMMVAVLNCAGEEGSAWLAGRFLRESFARGGRACRTMVASPTLDAAFITPALEFLAARGAEVGFGRRLRGLTLGDGRVTGLDFGEGSVAVDAGDAVVLAVPPWVAAELLPGLTVPDQFTAILNAHFAVAPPPGTPFITALVGATSQWVVAHEARISVTISAADALIDTDREALARRIWSEVAATLGMDGSALPRWQIVKEKRATFASTPEQVARRPGPRTAHANLFLAGDWIDTGLPATIEGALRSGANAACLATRRAMRYRAAQ